MNANLEPVAGVDIRDVWCNWQAVTGRCHGDCSFNDSIFRFIQHHAGGNQAAMYISSIRQGNHPANTGDIASHISRDGKGSTQNSNAAIDN